MSATDPAVSHASQAPDVSTPSGEATVMQILRVADLLTRIGDAKVFGKELTQAQFNLLMVLKRHDGVGVSQKDILANLVSTKGNVSIHVTNLTRMGYIRKRVAVDDGRRHELTLTAKGRTRRRRRRFRWAGRGRIDRRRSGSDRATTRATRRPCRSRCR